MLPELFAFHVIGMVPSVGMTLYQIGHDMQKRKSPKFLNLQANLHKVGLYWVESRSEVVSFEEGLEEFEESTQRRTFLLMGFGCVFLGWLGFLIQLLVFLSSTRLAKPRLEQSLMGSELSERVMEADKVKAALGGLSIRY